jgi:phosphate transport system permease protein
MKNLRVEVQAPETGSDRLAQSSDRTMGLSPQFKSNLNSRNRTANAWRVVFQFSTVTGIIFLSLLLYTIFNQSFGYVAVKYKINPNTLAVNGVPLDEMDAADLMTVLKTNLSSGLARQLEREKPLTERSRNELFSLVQERVLKLEVLDAWTLSESLLHGADIRTQVVADYPEAELKFTSWLNPHLITSAQSADPLRSGIRIAIMGSLWTIAITVLVAFPLGVGSAIYLEEYAVDNWLNRLILTNINNLAGVPSIIYGILGLAIFVRALQPLSSGAIFGIGDPSTANGRTILAAGLTLAILILPLIIINGQEAIRAVPISLRQASYGLGATKWQTIWHHVLPSAMPGILTGTILAISRAIGETAPLVVVGAATFITTNPSSPFSKFTTLPIQIYQWTSRPQVEFRNLAAAAILVLLILLLSLNAVAILLRNRFSKAGRE